MAEVFDIICVGGGLSGLVAAYKVLKQNPTWKVLVLEAKDRVGGRTMLREMKCADSNGDETTYSWEFGGMWVGRCQPNIMGLLKELEMETYDQYITGKKCLQLLKDPHVKTYTSDIPSIGIVGALDMGQSLYRIESLIKKVSVENPWNSPNAADLDSITAETLMQKYCFTKSAKEMFQVACRTIFGAEASQISGLAFLSYCSAAGSLAQMIESNEGSAQEFKIKGGSQSVSLKLIEDTITWDRVKLSEPVTCVDQTDTNAVVVTTAAGTYRTQCVIMATPPNQTMTVSFSPLLPAGKIQLYKQMPMGHLIKVIITYKKTYWREAGYSAEVVTSHPLASAEMGEHETGPLSICFDATSDHGHPAIVGFIGGNQATEWADEEASIRKEAVVSCLAEMFSCPEMREPMDYYEKDWSKEAYNGGCPTNVTSPGVMKYYSDGLRQTFDRVVFAGTEASTEWCGFLDGAVKAGEIAAINAVRLVAQQTKNS